MFNGLVWKDTFERKTAIEEMSPEDCLTFLTTTTTLGRVAFHSSRGQQLLPVNFVFENDRVYFRTARGGILAELAGGKDDVAFEIDYPDRLTQHGWSVMVHGSTREVTAEEFLQRVDRAPRPWAPGTRDVLIELVPRTISGRKIRNASR